MFSGDEDQLFPIFDQDEYLNDPFQIIQPSFMNNTIHGNDGRPSMTMCGALQTPAVQLQADDLTTTSMKKNPRKDKHSKIVTAKGPRDRRMRLSLDVAKRFFDLQDVLGFDKASKTLDWLISKSTDAIKSVTAWGGSMTSSQPESRGRSCIADHHDVLTSSEIRRKAKAKEKMKMKTTDPKLVKESRKKARERARERTIEKKMLLLQQQQNPFNFYHKY